MNETIKTIPVDLPVNTTFHIWMKAMQAGTPGTLSLTSPRGKFGEVQVTNADENEFRIYQVFGGGAIELRYDTAATSVSVIYWFTAADVLETGITVVHTNPSNAPPDLPAGYHFRPPFGWMNDPNGFGRFGGRPHLFYQHYSHGRTWNTMHWGHAVSSDYLRWRHLPVFLFPSEELTSRPDRRGGAFSGSAIPLVDGAGIRVFFTEQVPDRQPEAQIQLSAVSSDLITAGHAEVILPLRPVDPGLTHDFRDPYVFRGPDGLWKMLLGSNSADGGVILLYETEDHTAASGWTYVGKLVLAQMEGTTAAECPCLLPLDGPASDPATRWVLIWGMMHSLDEGTGRRNLTLARIGWFDGRKFNAESQHELDFGTDNYAFQAFVDGGTIVGIGWLANWADTGPKIDFPTAMTLPRQLVYANGFLHTPPIADAESLRHRILDRTQLARGHEVGLANGAAEILIDFHEPGAPFLLEFNHSDAVLAVFQDEEGLHIHYRGASTEEGPRYVARGARARQFRIFVDYGSIEVFADNGRWTGTKRFDGFKPVESAQLRCETEQIERATVWALAL